MNANVVQYVPTRPDSIPEQMSQVEDVVQGKGVAPLVIRAWHSTVRSLISWAAWAYFPARLSKMTPV